MSHSPIFFYTLDLQIGPLFPWSTVREDSSSQPQSWWGCQGMQMGITKPLPWDSVATKYFKLSMLFYQRFFFPQRKIVIFSLENLSKTVYCINSFVMFLCPYLIPSTLCQIPQRKRALQMKKMTKTFWSFSLLFCARKLEFSLAAAMISSWGSFRNILDLKETICPHIS